MLCSFPGLLGTHGIGGAVVGSCGGDLWQLALENNLVAVQSLIVLFLNLGAFSSQTQNFLSVTSMFDRMSGGLFEH